MTRSLQSERAIAGSRPIWPLTRGSCAALRGNSGVRLDVRNVARARRSLNRSTRRSGQGKPSSSLLVTSHFQPARPASAATPPTANPRRDSRRR